MRGEFTRKNNQPTKKQIISGIYAPINMVILYSKHDKHQYIPSRVRWIPPIALRFLGALVDVSILQELIQEYLLN